MNLSKSFEEFLEEGIIKRQRQDQSRAQSLIEEAQSRKTFLKEITTKIGINETNANYFVETSYDIIMELIRAKLQIDGYKSNGAYAHEAEISYLKKLGMPDSKIRIINELRYFRNSINYYGKKIDATYAKKITEFIEQEYEHLLGLIKKPKT